MFIARKRDTDPSKPPQFSFDKKDRRVTVYYFYLWDAEFGPAFIKICTYCPWPVKIWVNGHEWAKQQARKAGLRLHRAVQRLCLLRGSRPCCSGSATRCSRAPSRCSSSGGCTGCRCRSAPADQQAGYWWECSMAQVEVSRTIVFTQPRYARAFFDALVTDNLDLGRPDTIEIIFDRQVRAGQQRATRRVQDQGRSPAAPRSPSTPSTSTPASSST